VSRKKKKKVERVFSSEEEWRKYKGQQLRTNHLARLKKIAKGQYKARMDEVPMPKVFAEWLKDKGPFVDEYTGEPILKRSSMEVDHNIPTSREGSFSLSNLVITSKRNNRAKGDLTGEEYCALLRTIALWPTKASESVITRLIRASCTFVRRWK